MSLTGIWSLIAEIMRQIDREGLELDKDPQKYRAFHSHVFDKDVYVEVSHKSNLTFKDGHIGNGYTFNLFLGDECIAVEGVYRDDGIIDESDLPDAISEMVGILEKRMEEHKKASV